MIGQGFYVNKITYHCLEYSFILLYLSEEENEDYDLRNALHFKSSISWTGTISGVRFRLKTKNHLVSKTVAELIKNLHKQMATNKLYLDTIEETELTTYMIKEVENFVKKFVTDCSQIATTL